RTGEGRPNIGAKKPPMIDRPAASDISDIDGAPRFDITRAIRNALTASAMNPRPPAAKCTMPVVLMAVGAPDDVPGGKPSIGSAGKNAATIMLMPKHARKMLVARFGRITRAMPTAAAITIAP